MMKSPSRCLVMLGLAPAMTACGSDAQGTESR
jgi:hypothetical protein